MAKTDQHARICVGENSYAWSGLEILALYYFAEKPLYKRIIQTYTNTRTQINTKDKYVMLCWWEA